MKHLNMLNDLVLIQPEINGETITESGIIIPESRKREAVARGVVLRTGPGNLVDGKRTPMVVKPDDRVLFSLRSGTEVVMNNTLLIVLHESDILAVEER